MRVEYYTRRDIEIQSRTTIFLTMVQYYRSPTTAARSVHLPGPLRFPQLRARPSIMQASLMHRSRVNAAASEARAGGQTPGGAGGLCGGGSRARSTARAPLTRF